MVEGSGTALIFENWALTESNAGALNDDVKLAEASSADVNLSVLNPLGSLNPITVPIGSVTDPLLIKLLPVS